MISLLLKVTLYSILSPYTPLFRTDRHDPRHHPRPSKDQQRGGGLLAARSRAAGHLSRRDRDRGTSGPAIHALGLALWAEPGDSGVRRRHRHLFRAAAGQRTAADGAVAITRRCRARNEIGRAHV